MKKINFISKFIVIFFFINLLSIIGALKTYASTYNQVYISPIEANNNGIDAFPKSYQTLLKKLVENTEHTNWKFKALYTDIDWNELVANETDCLHNTIYKSSTSPYPSSWYDSCNKQGDTGFYCASKEITSYYMDPRNFLTEITIFQFLDLSNSSSVSVAQIKEVVKGTYLEGSVNGESYAQMIYDAAETSGESAFSIIVRIFQELGNGKNLPLMISGKDSTYPGVYNFFNYGATDGSGNSVRGLEYAKNAGWTTPRKALVEGAKLIAGTYTKAGQVNKYLYKFDVVGQTENDLYGHQYMTNVEDPTSQADSLYKTYDTNNLLDKSLTFVIPVYKNMPEYVKLPNNETGTLYYVSSNSGSVYLRNGPGGAESGYSNIASLRKDTVVSMLQSGINGWAKISCNGQVGYMSEKYLTKVNLEKDIYKVPTNTELPFKDVWTDDWYYEAVKYTYKSDIIKGANETEFKPNTKLSRGMLVTILWRMEGSPQVTTNTSFPDVKDTEYYSTPIKWAASKGIVSGYSSGKFGPNDNITREQLAVILRKYAKYKGKDVSRLVNISSYKDASKVSSFAKEGVQWAIAKGIISGKNNGTRIDPQGPATRAEAAAMITNYCIKIK